MFEHSFVKEKTCRTCTKTDTELSPLFTKQDDLDGVSLSDMITECTMYAFQNDEDLPPSICLECTDKAKIAYHFKKQCEESQQRLLFMVQWMKENPVDVAESKVNYSTPEENTETLLIEDSSNIRKKSTRNTSSKSYPCEKCDQIFITPALLKEHVSADHKVPKHSCSMCGKEFIRLGHLTNHINKVHKNDALAENTTKSALVKVEIAPAVEPEARLENEPEEHHDADELDFNFGTDNEDNNIYEPDSESLKSVKDELEISDDKIKLMEALPLNETCQLADEIKPDELEEQQKLDDNIKQEEKKDSSFLTSPDANRRFQCNQCHKAFKRKSHLTQHTLCHSKVKRYECPICQKKFGRADNLKVHMTNHGQKKFECNSCDRSFGQAYLLKRHKDQTHSEEKPFLCSECGQRFVRNGDLAVHMRRHTGEKPYKCQYCDKGFTRSTEVYVHERYHTGEKRHICSTCGKAFQRPYNLLVHVRTHTGERPYQCPHCPKNFAQCSDLKAHIRRHTGERYRCEQCGMGFIHVFVLNQHKLSVHGIEVPSRIKRIPKLSTDTQ